MAKAQVEFTHQQLTDVALRWLMRPESARGPGCKIALAEVGALGSSEIADAYGYRWGWLAGSTVVEVNVSRSDFLRDKHKPHRINPDKGMGQFRYYMCPEGMIQVNDLPDMWGLLWVNARGHVKVMAGHVTAYLPYSMIVDGQLVENWHNRELAHFWRFERYDLDSERALMAYLLMRLGDPDKALKDSREAHRLASKRLSENEQLERENKDMRHDTYRLKRICEAAGLDVPALHIDKRHQSLLDAFSGLTVQTDDDT